jgi:hypothetical protein
MSICYINRAQSTSKVSRPHSVIVLLVSVDTLKASSTLIQNVSPIHCVPILHCGWRTYCLVYKSQTISCFHNVPPRPPSILPWTMSIHTNLPSHSHFSFLYPLSFPSPHILHNSSYIRTTYTTPNTQYKSSHHHTHQPTYQSTNNYAVCTNFIRTNNTSNDDFFNHTPRRRRSSAQHDQRHHYPSRRTPRLASPSRRARTAASRQRGNPDCRLGWNW